MCFKRKVHCLVAFIMSALLCVTVLSACKQTAEVQVEETTATSTTTTVSETTTQTTTEETKTVSKIEEKTEQTTTADTTKLEETTIITTKLAETVATATKPETTIAPTETSTTVSKSQTAAPIEYEAHNEMPEIVFINLSNSGYSENVVYGYFINNKGEVRYFEYLDEKGQDYAEEKNINGYPKWYYTSNFTEMNFSKDLLNEMYDNIIAESLDTGERIKEDKLKKIYNQLLSVDSSKGYKVDSDEDWADVEFKVSHTYGIRKKSDNTNEIILLRGGGQVSFLNKDDSANLIFDQVKSFFPRLSIDYIPKLLQNEDEQQEE